MNHRLSDIAGDAYPASEPQAVNDARPKVQPIAPRPDYTQVEPSDTPVTYNWVVVGKDQVMIHPTADHSLMLEMSQHSHFSRPHATGILHLFDRWDAEFELTSSNLSLDLVTKALKKASKAHGWNFKGLIDEDGLPHSEKSAAKIAGRVSKTAADFGVGPNNPGVKDYMNKGWAGTDQFDQMPPPGWDDGPDESEPHSGPYECSDCEAAFPDYGQWRDHVMAEHTKRPSDKSPDPSPMNPDATFPPKEMDWGRVQDLEGVTAAAPKGWNNA